jgi:hypothetical protein
MTAPPRHDPSESDRAHFREVFGGVQLSHFLNLVLSTQNQCGFRSCGRRIDWPSASIWKAGNRFRKKEDAAGVKFCDRIEAAPETKSAA